MHAHDVFVSYNQADAAWVTGELFERLNGRRITYIEPARFEPGILADVALETAIEGSRRVLLVITRNYLSDRLSAYSTSIALAHMIEHASARVIPALKESCTLPATLGALVRVNFSDTETLDAEWERLLSTLASAIDGATSPSGTKNPRGDSHSAKASLVELKALSADAEIRALISKWKVEFGDLRRKIRLLYAYKNVHDQCQRLEDHYNLIDCCVLGHGQAQVDLSFVAIIGGQLPAIQSSLLSAAQQAEFLIDAAQWVDNLNRAVVALNVAPAEITPSGVRTALGQLRRVLGFLPGRANSAMVLGVKNLRLSSVHDALCSVLHVLGQQPGTVAPDRLAKLEDGIHQIEEFDATLKAELYRHDRHQELDLQLREIEAALRTTSPEIEESWANVMQLTHRLCDGCDAPWAAGLLRSTTIAAEAVNRHTRIDDVRRPFQSVRSEATRAFNETDRRLLEICNKLEEEVGKPLNPLLALAQSELT